MKYTQGDVFIESIDKIPNGVKKKDNILAYGEITGHRHRFESKAIQVFVDEDKQQFIEVSNNEEGLLVHEEHDTVHLPKGKYKVRLQREYDVIEGTRAVTD